jgi:hypothetical protein
MQRTPARVLDPCAAWRAHAPCRVTNPPTRRSPLLAVACRSPLAVVTPPPPRGRPQVASLRGPRATDAPYHGYARVGAVADESETPTTSTTASSHGWEFWIGAYLTLPVPLVPLRWHSLAGSPGPQTAVAPSRTWWRCVPTASLSRTSCSPRTRSSAFPCPSRHPLGVCDARMIPPDGLRHCRGLP